MQTIKITKTVFPENKPADFNEWSKWFFGQFKVNLPIEKKEWDKNIYKPKK